MVKKNSTHHQSIFFQHSTIINDLDIDNSLSTSYQIVLLRVQEWLSAVSGWLI